MGKKDKKTAVAAANAVVLDQPLSLPILETIKFSQQQNGLRFGDYTRYRQHCARRLRRLRKGLKFVHGKGKQFVPKEVTPDIASEVRHLMLPLYHSERAWSYAMQLREDERNDKDEHGDEASSRIKFHLLGRLKKAVAWSDKLTALCAERADVRTNLEAEAYASYMSGNLALYKEEWKVALEKFSTAQRIYSELAKVGTVVQQDLLHQILDEISPFMRYCEYNLGGSSSLSLQELRESTTSALLQSKIDQVFHEEAKTKAKDMAAITWRGRAIPIPNSDVSVALVRPEEHLAKLKKGTDNDKKRDAIYVDLFGCYDMILRLLAAEKIKTDTMKSGFMADAHRENVTALDEYVRYIKQTHVIDRNVVLFTQLKSRLGGGGVGPGDLIHILDMLIRNVDDMAAIPGTTDHGPFKAYQALQCTFHAFRCNYVAQVYVGQNKFPESAALYDQAKTYLMQAMSLESDDATVRQFISELEPQVMGAHSRVNALGFLHDANTTEAVRVCLGQLQVTPAAGATTTRSLLERQNEYSSGNPATHYDLVTLPPQPHPIPVKPLLFDIALTEMEVPDVHARVENKSSTGVGGFLGWLRGSSA
ncbi:hypothetical protein H310_11532 [Aphanomyces invadans]|uniref:Signal recognition particle subunit SRP68 n=1 Tax=Aphanomyces invadans TaxID=157072 RepID=A0A024TMN8_9STRA|nr:hypothetical protein H310_11532 [Aphanomyces invadans]ETV94876.1 hypothetical protein H310_11532 [Aphanomyces invadans]|eukprot:XP_008876467.1 hypothetical protein H310_11532 [Aphanomyces invadans]